MQLITPYSPPTFLKPNIIISTLAHETAICFVEALNGNHAMRLIYTKDKDESLKMSEFIVVKKHKTPEAAMKYHMGLANKLRNGESDAIWNRGWKPYLKLYEAHCPENMRDPFDKVTLNEAK